MGRVLQPKRDKYYNTQKKIYAVKKPINKQPVAEQVLQNLNSNFSLPRLPITSSSFSKLQPLSTTTPKHQDVLNTSFQQKKHINTSSKLGRQANEADSSLAKNCAADVAAVSPFSLVGSIPSQADSHPPHSKNPEESLAQWHGALSLQLDAADKALFATAALNSLVPFVTRDVEAHPEEYINKVTGDGLMSEYFRTVGNKYMDIAHKCIKMASEFSEKGV